MSGGCRCRLAVACWLVAVGCSGTDRAALDLVVTSDLEVPQALDAIRLTVTAARTPAGEQCAPVERLFALETPSDLPLRGIIEAGTEFGAWVALRVTGTAGGVEVARKERLLAWPDDEREMAIDLEAACRSVACETDQQCEGGRCVDLPDPGVFDDETRWDPAPSCDARAQTEERGGEGGG